jgi:predicted secreted protein
MKPVSIIAIYLLFWSITLFAVLPFGVRTTREEGREPVPGEADSAPANPMLWAKIKWTTVIATALFALFYANYVQGWVVMADIPGWADKGPYKPRE